jgi:hypothetical protein
MFMRGHEQMTTTKKQTGTNATPGFAVELKPTTDLGLAILMVIFENGKYEPVGVVASTSEADEIAKNHHQHYRASHPGYTIASYELWAQGLGGEYRRVPVAL